MTYQSKDMANVKVVTGKQADKRARRQTDQRTNGEAKKLYVPDLSMRRHKKTKMKKTSCYYFQDIFKLVKVGLWGKNRKREKNRIENTGKLNLSLNDRILDSFKECTDDKLKVVLKNDFCPCY